MNRKEVERIVSKVSFADWRFEVISRGRRQAPLHFIHVVVEGKDNVTGEPTKWNGRKWFVSEHATEGEVVQTCWLAVITALEHEAREVFKYEELTVFDPHYDIQQLAAFRMQPESIKRREVIDADPRA